MSNKYKKTLKKYFKLHSFREHQEEIITAIIEEKKDVSITAFTGFGKSLCFQFPPVHLQKVCIVISPLISLMNDQSMQLSSLGIPSCCLNGTVKNKNDVKKDILDNKYRLVYTTPEYIINAQKFIKELEETNLLVLIAIDESHCISSYGHDFRTSYKQLDKLKQWVNKVPIITLTATATPLVHKDIIATVKLENPLIIRTNFDRPNLYIKVLPKKDITKDIVPLLLNKKPTIIYCLTRKETENIRDVLIKNGVSCGSYHGGMKANDRKQIHEDFAKKLLTCICATQAYGLGINLIIRKVIHYGLPKDIESYYQEMGRAGRDGKRSKCYLFYALKDLAVNKFLINKIDDQKYRNYKLSLMGVVKKYIYTSKCRRIMILKYFGETYSKLNCKNCDNCMGKNRSVKHDLTKEALIFLQTVKYTGNMYGGTMIVNILRGSNSKKVPARFKKLKVFGVGKYKSVIWWKTFVKLLESVDYIRELSIEGQYGSTIEWTQKGKIWLEKVAGPNLIEPKENCTNNLIMRLPEDLL